MSGSESSQRWVGALTVISVVVGLITGALYLLVMYIENVVGELSGQEPSPVVEGIAVIGITAGGLGMLLRWTWPVLGLGLTLAATLPVVLYASHTPWVWGSALLAFAVHLTLLVHNVGLGPWGRTVVGVGVVGVLFLLGTPWSSLSSCAPDSDPSCRDETWYRAPMSFPHFDFPDEQNLVLRAVFALMAVALIAGAGRPVRVSRWTPR